MELMGRDSVRDHYFAEMVGTIPGGRNQYTQVAADGHSARPTYFQENLQMHQP